MREHSLSQISIRILPLYKEPPIYADNTCATSIAVVRIPIMATAEQFTLLSIGLCTITVRVYMRWRSVGPANFQIDDYLMPIVGVSSPTSFLHVYKR
jgi:hypothetical protein